jgi:DNA (cytosine-5)-methyltransferase 1
VSHPLVLELFAGAGGASLGLQRAHPHALHVGIENDEVTCRTRRAAGLLTIRADVAEYPTEPFAGKVWGLWASPPCPDFSPAGRRRGLSGDTGHLIFQVPRWVHAVRPEWLACEQVNDRIPLDWWRTFAEEFRTLGYHVWVGVLCAADFGVPQERYRAILMASLRGPVTPPQRTHAEYPTFDLFGNSTLPWVSMAEGLGWGMTDRPCMTVTSGGTRTGGAEPIRSRDLLIKREREIVGYRRVRGEGMTERHGLRRVHPSDEPAPTITSKARSDELVLNTRQKSLLGGSRTVDYKRSAQRPSPTLTAQAGGFWQWERPATTVCGDPRIPAPGYRTGTQRSLTPAVSAAKAAAGEQTGTEAVKLTIRDALLLQGFPEDYPVRGSRTKQFEQVGNAVPPALAQAIAAALDAIKEAS